MLKLLYQSNQKDFVLKKDTRNDLEILDSNIPNNSVLDIEGTTLTVLYDGKGRYVLSQESYGKVVTFGRRLKVLAKVYGKGRINFGSCYIKVNDPQVKQTEYGAKYPFLDCNLTYYDEKSESNIFFSLWVEFDENFAIASDSDGKCIYYAQTMLLAPVSDVYQCDSLTEAIECIYKDGEKASQTEKSYETSWGGHSFNSPLNIMEVEENKAGTKNQAKRQ